MERMTIDRVAELAYVSRSLVSRVLNNHPHVSAESRERVMRVIDQYNYKPYSVARRLSWRRTRDIGLLVFQPEGTASVDQSVTRFILDVTEQCSRNDLYVFLSVVPSDARDRRVALEERDCDGAIVLGHHASDHLLGYIRRNRLPSVLVGQGVHFEDLNTVNPDHLAGGFRAVKHLLDRGHTRIGAIAGPTNQVEAGERLRGYQRALSLRGIPIEQNLIVHCDGTLEGGYDGLRRLQSLEPTAVFCLSDEMAIGALMFVRDQTRGEWSPAVVGYGDSGTAPRSLPSLSTVRMPVAAMSKAAVRLLVSQIDGEVDGVRHVRLEPELIVRESCGAGKHAPANH